MCSYENYLSGKVNLCHVKKGESLQHYDNGDDLMEDKDEDEYGDESEDKDDNEGTQSEAMQARGNSVFDAVKNETTITLILPPTSYDELFYLCQVPNMKIAAKKICDIYNHAVAQGGKYLECQYYEKVAE